MFETNAFGGEKNTAKDGDLHELSTGKGACIANGLQQMQDYSILFEVMSMCRLA